MKQYKLYDNIPNPILVFAGDICGKVMLRFGGISWICQEVYRVPDIPSRT